MEEFNVDNNMSKENLQYISDSILMNRFFSMEPYMVKQAGLFDSLGFNTFGGFIQKTFQKFVEDNFDPDDPGGIIGGVLHLIVQGTIFKANPLVWILVNALASLLGIDTKNVLGHIVDKVGSVLKSTGKISADQVTSIGRSVAGSLSATACDDMLYILRKYDSEGELDKIIRRAYIIALAVTKPKGPKIPWLGEKGSKSVLTKIFGVDLFRKVPKGRFAFLFVGILTWIVKTALLGAGLLVGAKAIGSLISKDDKDKKVKVEEIPEEEAVKIFKELPEKPSVKEDKEITQIVSSSLLNSSGKGEKYFTNDRNSLWIVPILDNVENTVLQWVFLVYPNLDTPIGETAILSSSLFQRVVNTLERNYSPNMPDELVMPEMFHSLKQIVDIFAEDAAEKIGY